MGRIIDLRGNIIIADEFQGDLDGTVIEDAENVVFDPIGLDWTASTDVQGALEDLGDFVLDETKEKTEVVALAALGGTITGATANDTMTAVADASAAETETSAASLTSVNTAIAAIEDNFADLQTKVNAIIAALKA